MPPGPSDLIMPRDRFLGLAPSVGAKSILRRHVSSTATAAESPIGSWPDPSALPSSISPEPTSTCWEPREPAGRKSTFDLRRPNRAFQRFELGGANSAPPLPLVHADSAEGSGDSSSGGICTASSSGTREVSSSCSGIKTPAIPAWRQLLAERRVTAHGQQSSEPGTVLMAGGASDGTLDICNTF